VSKASKSLREYVPDRRTVLIDRLKISHPEIFPIRGAKYNHGPLCASARYFVACDCAVTVTLADGKTYS
jgi:hypothetical protein